MGIPYGRLEEEELRYLDDERRSARRDAALLMRTAVARALSPRHGGRELERPFIVSAHVANLTIDDAVSAIFAPRSAERADRAKMVHFVHPHALNLATFSREFRGMLAEADLVLPDGIGVRLAASLLGVSMRHNLNGTDLLPVLCREAASRDLPMALVGGAPGVAADCGEVLRRQQPGLRIALTQAGYLDDAGSAQVAASIRELGPSIVLVGMGSWRQEQWAWRWLRDANEAVVVTVGGLFDFFSGQVPRAPVAWRELGLEWLWRLRQEPGRLGKRYLVGNPLFLALAVAQRLRLR